MLKEYYFKFSNGAVRKMTENGANRFSADSKLTILDCNEDGVFKDTRRIRDGFTPGWQPSLGMVVTCPGRYKQIIKDRGLIEVGNEKPMNHEYDVKRSEKTQKLAYFDDKTLREISNDVGGLSVSDGEIRQIRDNIDEIGEA